MAKKTLRERAIELSRIGYTTELLRDKTTDGDQIYLALNPELEGCMAQGETPQDAITNLEEVRVDYFEHLLEFNLPIPNAKPAETRDTVGKNITQTKVYNITFPGFEAYLTQDVQLNEREKLFSVTPST